MVYVDLNVSLDWSMTYGINTFGKPDKIDKTSLEHYCINKLNCVVIVKENLQMSSREVVLQSRKHMFKK